MHVDDASCADAVRLADLLQSFGYVQHVTTATHTAGHTLDLVIARTDTDISDVDVGGFISDHAFARFTIRVRRLIDAPQPVSCRALKRYEKDVFARDLAASQLFSNIEQLSDKSADDLAVLYRDVMTQLLDKHCPVVTVCRRPRFVSTNACELHWLDVTDRVRFKLAVLMYRCFHGTAPPYLIDSCTLTAEVTGRQHLRFATQRKLVVPRYQLNSFGRRRFSVAGPSIWNSLPDSLRDPELSSILSNVS